MESSTGIRRYPQISVALPFRMMQRKIPYLRKRGLGVQVMLYDTNWICDWPKEEVSQTGCRFRDAGIDVSVHGPVHDLNPGSLDVVIRDYTQHCFFKTLVVCQALDAKNLVFHLGINPLLPKSALDAWLENSLRTWGPIVDLARQLQITIELENMFLPSPRFLVALKEGLASDTIKFCFDVGHFHVYSTASLEQWLQELDDDIVELHLNDNSGTDDEHLALGAGTIDFPKVFSMLFERSIHPRLTLEMTSNKFEPSLAYLAEKGISAAPTGI